MLIRQAHSNFYRSPPKIYKVARIIICLGRGPVFTYNFSPFLFSNSSINVVIEIIELKMCYINFISYKHFYIEMVKYNHDFNF